jgi:hypothetical protein
MVHRTERKHAPVTEHVAVPPRYVPADSPDSIQMPADSPDEPPQRALDTRSLAECLALGSADDVEAGLRRIHEWRPLPVHRL